MLKININKMPLKCVTLGCSMKSTMKNARCLSLLQFPEELERYIRPIGVIGPTTDGTKK